MPNPHAAGPRRRRADARSPALDPGRIGGHAGGMQAVCWDLDGTLVDTLADLAAAANAVRGQVGLDPLPAAAVRGMIGDGVAALLTRVLAPLAPRAEDRAAFLASYGAICDRSSPAFPGIRAAVDRLQAAGVAQAVVTNKPDAFVPRILAAAGLDAIRVRIGGDGPRKPDPAPVRLALARLGVAAERAWMVGDHRTDLAAGAGAGCRTVFCTWGYGEAGGERADAVAGTPAAVLAAVLGAAA